MKRSIGKFLVGTVAALTVLAHTAPTEARDYRLGTIVPAGHLWNQAAQRMNDALSERSGGEDGVSVFPAGQLGDESQMVQQLQTGALDMAFLTIADVTNRVPDFGALYAPFLVEDVAGANKVLASEPAQALLGRLPKEMGVVGIDYGIATMRQIMTNFPVDDISDLAGRKMRITPFKPFRDFYNILGIAPTPMPLPEVYDALANGQVDAMDIDPELILNFKFYERADHLLLTNHSMFPMVGLVSGRVWASLSDDEKQRLRETMREQLAWVRQQYEEQEPQMIEKIRTTGIEVKPVDQSFFPGVVAKWEEIWADQKPLTDELRAVAASE
ncbi:MAG: TRAP transporter substrate-binding protein [Aurantimonas endophytica]|uniref:TRAP transporter substrate-binding protein n=1 Tax=Aurantimonas endophytica TaxID=1522175 RepID=UPI0030029041